MPLLQFYTNIGQLTKNEKQELAIRVTAIYTKILPAFYVNIVFNELPHGNLFVAGKPAEGKFVRFTADHIAVNWVTDEERKNSGKRYLDAIKNIFEELFGKKGWTWEYHVTQSERDLWRIQGLVPPEIGTEAFKSWFEGGKAIPWEGIENV